jgi:hypothetical protein
MIVSLTGSRAFQRGCLLFTETATLRHPGSPKIKLSPLSASLS